MSDEPLPSYEGRFAFLFPKTGRPRYQLHAPDLLELRWSVFDTQSKQTIAYGHTAEDAVDVAVSVDWHEQVKKGAIAAETRSKSRH